MVDNLTYTHNGNRLSQITDAQSSNSTNEFVQRGNASYTFWPDGSLKSDANEQIANTSYDLFLKQPKEITLTDGRWIKHFYDGSGALLKTQYSTGEVFEYIGGQVFKNGVLFQTNMPEGRVIHQNGAFKYEFDYKDHLGNTRVSFLANGNQLEKTAETTFDPWGLTLGIGQTNATQNRFEYQDKERELTFGLNRVNLGARTVNPTTGVFDRIDILGGVQPNLSLFNFVSNNPLNRIDPTGLIDEWVEKDGQMLYDNRVTNQNDATALYGEGAIYRPNGYSYSTPYGSKVELGDYGFYKVNGIIKSSPDLSQNSLAFTNPIQSLANAQNQIVGLKANFRISQGVTGFIATDIATPDPTDSAWPKWVAYTIAGGAAFYYVNKMLDEIEGIMRRAGGPNGVQYSLKAVKSGSYLCYLCSSGTMNLNNNDIWKYGETTKPVRYSQSELKTWGVIQINEYYGNQVQIKVMEKLKIYSYYLQNGHLPPGNKIFR